MLFYVPNTFSASTLMTEEGDVACVGLGIVGTDKAEECGFATSVLSKQCPFLSLVYSP